MRSTAQLPTGNFRFQFHHSARVSRILHSGMKAVWFFSACVFFFPATANSFGFTSGWVTSGLGNSARASTSPGLSRADTAARRRLHAGVSRHYRQQRINVLSTKALRDPKEEGEDETLDILPELRRSGKLNERGADEEVSEVDGAFQTSLSSLFRPQAVAPKEAASRLKKPPLPFSQNIKDLLRRLEVPIALTVVLGCFVLAGQTLHDDPKLEIILNRAEDVINTVFIAEYLLRWYSRNLELGYLVKGEMLVDFVSFLPFLLRQLNLASFSGLTFVRLLRVLRLQRCLRDAPSFQRIAGPWAGRVEPYQLQITRIGSTIFTTLFITSGLIYAVEAPYNPNLSNYFSAFYFSLTSLTTVGFGDITPVTPAGKAVVSGAILVGIGLIPYQLSNAVEAVLASKQRAVPCPRCAEATHMPKANFCWRCGSELPPPRSSSRTLSRLNPPPGSSISEEGSDDFFS
mmetsp:Transcript_12306/g.29401  ORF Transcript_12306/g.29401 Transcript_12306/m.29401 type:complete len:459 (-) Transcript_12306:80-1456(-)